MTINWCEFSVRTDDVESGEVNFHHWYHFTQEASTGPAGGSGTAGGVNLKVVDNFWLDGFTNWDWNQAQAGAEAITIASGSNLNKCWGNPMPWNGSGYQAFTNSGAYNKLWDNETGFFGELELEGHMRLFVTDTDGNRDGEIWYDDSENVIKYRGASGTKTLADAV